LTARDAVIPKADTNVTPETTVSESQSLLTHDLDLDELREQLLRKTDETIEWLHRFSLVIRQGGTRDPLSRGPRDPLSRVSKFKIFEDFEVYEGEKKIEPVNIDCSSAEPIHPTIRTESSNRNDEWLQEQLSEAISNVNSLEVYEGGQKKVIRVEIGGLFDEFVRRVVRDRLPKNDDGTNVDRWLHERLSVAICVRRRHFLYVREHQRKLNAPRRPARQPEEPPGVKIRTPVPSSSSSKPIPTSEVRMTIPENPGSSVRSETNASFQPLDNVGLQSAPLPALSTTSSRLITPMECEVPPAPRLQTGSKEYQCPYCCLVWPAEEFTNRDNWKRHVTLDLRPYICLYQNCQFPEELYASFRDWRRHMQKPHDTEWVCPVYTRMKRKAQRDSCNTNNATTERRATACGVSNFDKQPWLFHSQDALEEHMKAIHLSLFSASQISVLAKRSKRASRPTSVCPFGCTSFSNTFYQHVAAHLQDLALMSLPWRDDVASDDSEAESVITIASRRESQLGLNDIAKLLSRYERTGNIGDLEVAISNAEQAISATPKDHPDRAAMPSILGSMLSSRYERTGNIDDLEAAISNAEQAISATPEDHPDRAAMLSNLGSMLSSRYERTGNTDDLETAISRVELAVSATPEDHPVRARPQQRPKHLGDRLRVAVKHSPLCNRDFLPNSTLRELVTAKSVDEELARLKYLRRRVSQGWRRTSTIRIEAKENRGIFKLRSRSTSDLLRQEAEQTYRRVFAILTFIDRPTCIWDFVDEGVCDGVLPILHMTHGSVQLQGVESAKPLRCFRNWPPQAVYEFLESRWIVLAPSFIMDSKIAKHHVFKSEDILPITSWTISSVKGASGQVYKATIQASHHAFDKDVVAVKHLNSNGADPIRNREDFMNESGILRSLGRSNHMSQHLIALLATFERGGKYNLLFPWADGDLEDFWKQVSPQPGMSAWLIEQCRGLAEAMSIIHRYETTSGTMMPHQLSNLQRPAREETNEYGALSLIGRHGDIKPTNILWFRQESGDGYGILKITDFGITRFTPENMASKRAQGFVPNSATYRSPECDLSKQIGTHCDVWALGCVFLVFVTWFFGGYDEVEKFIKRRQSPDMFWAGANSDNFFTIEWDAQQKPRAEVKPAVTKVSILVLSC